MKLILAIVFLASYLFFAPDYFIELNAQILEFEPEEKIIRILRFWVMLAGAYAFVAFTPIEWFKWGK